MADEMRLIDANAIPYEEHYVPDGDVQWRYKKELCVLKPVIDQIPTVDAVEVVHGEWIDCYGWHNGEVSYHGIECSYCTGVFKAKSREDVIPWKEQFVRCPFCGAIMDGGNEDV